MPVSGFHKPIPHVFLRYAPGNAIGLYTKSRRHGGIQYVLYPGVKHSILLCISAPEIIVNDTFQGRTYTCVLQVVVCLSIYTMTNMKTEHLFVCRQTNA